MYAPTTQINIPQKKAATNNSMFLGHSSKKKKKRKKKKKKKKKSKFYQYYVVKVLKSRKNKTKITYLILIEFLTLVKRLHHLLQYLSIVVINNPMI